MAEKNKPSSPYTFDKFTNRTHEIEQISAVLQQSQPGIRAVVIDGDRGVGKTWLSLHLHRTIFKEKISGLTSWLFSLCSPGGDYHPWGDQVQKNECFVKENESLDLDGFLEVILNGLQVHLPPQPVAAEKVDVIHRYVQNHQDDRFVLMLDSAYESDWKLLEQLETHFLGKLLTLGNFFVIVTGRGRPYPWKTPLLIEATRFGLGKFTIGQVKEQLEKFDLSSILSVNDIYRIGEGWPLFTEHLARAKDKTDALDTAANILFAVVPIQERQKIREYFEALSTLDGFGEMEAALMVQAYEGGGPQDGRSICRKMNETRLISWKNGRYVMNQPVQNILQQYLPLKDKEAWVRLHCTAYRHFEAQARDRALERFSPFFESQMQNHAKALSEAGISDPHACPANDTKEAQS